MKDYVTPEATIIELCSQDVITTSESDNLGGTPSGWGE